MKLILNRRSFLLAGLVSTVVGFPLNASPAKAALMRAALKKVPSLVEPDVALSKENQVIIQQEVCKLMRAADAQKDHSPKDYLRQKYTETLKTIIEEWCKSPKDQQPDQVTALKLKQSYGLLVNLTVTVILLDAKYDAADMAATVDISKQYSINPNFFISCRNMNLIVLGMAKAKLDGKSLDFDVAEFVKSTQYFIVNGAPSGAENADIQTLINPLRIPSKVENPTEFKLIAEDIGWLIEAILAAPSEYLQSKPQNNRLAATRSPLIPS